MPLPVKSLSLRGTYTTSLHDSVGSGSAYVTGDSLYMEEGYVEPGYVEVDTPPYELSGNTWSVDGAGSEASLARNVIQESGLEVWVDGTKVDPGRLFGVQVSRARDRAIQTWQFDAHVDSDTGVGPFGTPKGQLGAPLGKRDVTIYAVYRTSAGNVYRVPLLTNGKADDYQSSDSPDSAEMIESHSGVDSMGCLSREQVNYVKAPGQRIRRDRAIRAMFEEAGATSFDLTPMRRTNKPLQFVEADPSSAAQELCEIEGRQIQVGPRGEIRNPKLRGSGTAQFAIYASDLLSFSISGPGDVVTRVTVNGTEYVAGEGDAGCPAQTATQKILQDSVYAPLRLRWSQASDCSITDNGSTTKEAALIQTRVTIRTTVKRCGVLVAERVEVWEWHSRETYRYVRDSIDSTALACRSGVRFLDGDAAPTANGSETAHDENETWRKVQQVDTQHYYDLPGWQLGNASLHAEAGIRLTHFGGDVVKDTTVDPNTKVVTKKYVHRGSKTAEQSYFGAYLGSLTVEKAWVSPLAALKSKPPGFDGNWGAVDYLSGVKVLGGGDAVDSPENDSRYQFAGTFDSGDPVFGPVRAEVVEVHSGSDRKIRREVSKVAGFAALPGGSYLYGDGKTYGEENQDYRHLATDETIYIEQGELSHTTILSHFDLIQPGNNQVTTEEKDGDRPSVEVLPFLDEEVVSEIEDFGGEEVLVSTVEAATARHGSEDENRAFTVPTIASSQLESRHCKHHLTLSAPHAENEQEAEQYGKMAISESAALPVTFEVILNGYLDEKDAVTLYHGRRGFDGQRVDLRSVVHSQQDRDTMPTTSVQGRIYLDSGI